MRQVHRTILRTLTALAALLWLGAAPAGAQAPPAGCLVWYDGCNTCQKVGETYACTKKACVRQGTPECRRWASGSGPARPGVPNWCARWYDGCNTCGRNARGGVICTRRHCGGRRGPFRCLARTVMPADCQLYFDGCNTCQRAGGAVICTMRACARRRAARCTVARRGGRMPAGCTRWYDGCNTCVRQADGRVRCTLRACRTNRGTPRCLDRQ